MNELHSAAPESSWEQIAPHLDEALAGLNESERDAVMLRYFEKKSAQEMAGILGVSSEAAQKRVSRAVEQLRSLLSRRGITVGSGALVALLSANAVQAAPAGLAAAIATATLAGTTSAFSTALAATTNLTAKTVTMTTIQKTFIAITIAALAGAGLYESFQSSRLREQNQTQQNEGDALAAQLKQAQAENARLISQIANNERQKSLSEAQFNELQQLRGQAGPMQKAVEETQKTPAAQNEPAKSTGPDWSGFMSMGRQMAKQQQKAELDHLANELHLSDSQKQAVDSIMTKHTESMFQLASNAMSGSQSMVDMMKMQDTMAADKDAAVNEIKGQLNADQLKTFEDLQNAKADEAAKANLASIMTINGMELSQDQQDRIRLAYLQNSFPSVSPDPQTANPEDAFINARKQELDAQLKVFQDVMTPEQLKIYQEHELKQIDRQVQMFKMFTTQKGNQAHGGQ